MIVFDKYDMNIENLEKVLKGEPKFRLAQANKAVFADLIEAWEENSTLPKNLKERLGKECPLRIDAQLASSGQSDSQKVLISFADGSAVEAVLLKHKDGRRTVCVSSQVGCAMGCLFCATGKMGFSRNLTCGEVVEQVLFFARILKKSDDSHKRVTNVVFMGMGEPFLNYENVLSAVRMLNDKDLFSIGARRISISTCGIIEGVEKLAGEDLQVNLAISLHAPNDELRSELMPIARQYPLEKLMIAVSDYAKKSLRQVMFEYMMIGGVNDTNQCAEELAKLMKNPLFVVNLIRYNAIENGKFSPSKPEAIKKFKEILLKKGVKVTQRYTFGQDIGAACGQLAGKKEDVDRSIQV